MNGHSFTPMGEALRAKELGLDMRTAKPLKRNSLQVNEVKMPRREEFRYEYEGGSFDFHYEESGATSEEMQHAEGCDWIYDNCNCGMVKMDHYDVEDDGDY